MWLLKLLCPHCCPLKCSTKRGPCPQALSAPKLDHASASWSSWCTSAGKCCCSSAFVSHAKSATPERRNRERKVGERGAAESAPALRSRRLVPPVLRPRGVAALRPAVPRTAEPLRQSHAAVQPQHAGAQHPRRFERAALRGRAEVRDGCVPHKVQLQALRRHRLCRSALRCLRARSPPQAEGAARQHPNSSCLARRAAAERSVTPASPAVRRWRRWLAHLADGLAGLVRRAREAPAARRRLHQQVNALARSPRGQPAASAAATAGPSLRVASRREGFRGMRRRGCRHAPEVRLGHVRHLQRRPPVRRRVALFVRAPGRLGKQLRRRPQRRRCDGAQRAQTPALGAAAGNKAS